MVNSYEDTERRGKTKMMQPQSPEFLIGYIFAVIERKYIKRHCDKSQNLNLSGPPNIYTVHVPLLWFGCKCTRATNNKKFDEAISIASGICKRVDAVLQDAFIYGKFITTVVHDKQYLRFVCTDLSEEAGYKKANK